MFELKEKLHLTQMFVRLNCEAEEELEGLFSGEYQASINLLLAALYALAEIPGESVPGMQFDGCISIASKIIIGGRRVQLGLGRART